MALAKKTLIILIVGIIVLVVGIGGGVYMGLQWMGKPQPNPEQVIRDPGPMVDLGQFTSTLADPETHVVKVKIMVELTSPKVSERLLDPGWPVMMKDEVIKTLKDQRYDNIRYAEGMEKLKQDLRTRLNAILPRVEGKSAVNRILFDEYMVQ